MKSIFNIYIVWKRLENKVRAEVRNHFYPRLVAVYQLFLNWRSTTTPRYKSVIFKWTICLLRLVQGKWNLKKKNSFKFLFLLWFLWFCVTCFFCFIKINDVCWTWKETFPKHFLRRGVTEKYIVLHFNPFLTLNIL